MIDPLELIEMPEYGIKKGPDEIIKTPSDRGRPPIGNDGKPIELHHRNQNPKGPIDEMTRTEHRLGDNFKKNHPNTGKESSEIDRDLWQKQRKKYWEEEWDSGRFNDKDKKGKKC